MNRFSQSLELVYNHNEFRYLSLLVFRRVCSHSNVSIVYAHYYVNENDPRRWGHSPMSVIGRLRPAILVYKRQSVKKGSKFFKNAQNRAIGGSIFFNLGQ